MKIGELKRSLTRFPADVDDQEVVIVYAIDGQTRYENLVGVGYLPIPEATPAGLVALSEIERQQTASTLPAAI